MSPTFTVYVQIPDLAGKKPHKIYKFGGATNFSSIRYQLMSTTPSRETNLLLQTTLQSSDLIDGISGPRTAASQRRRIEPLDGRRLIPDNLVIAVTHSHRR